MDMRIFVAIQGGTGDEDIYVGGNLMIGKGGMRIFMWLFKGGQWGSEDTWVQVKGGEGGEEDICMAV